MGRPVKKSSLHEIYITAKTTSGGSAQKVVGGNPTGIKTWTNGIVKQETSRGYFVQTGYGSARCRLVAKDNPGFEEATIIATDSSNNTYWVTKLTGHLALLTQKELIGSEWEFASGKDVEWTFGTAELGVKVTIENND